MPVLGVYWYAKPEKFVVDFNNICPIFFDHLNHMEKKSKPASSVTVMTPLSFGTDVLLSELVPFFLLILAIAKLALQM